MVTIRKRRKGKADYYYLEHTMRVDGTVEKKEKYLGKMIPADIEKIKADFMQEIYNEKWFSKLEAIQKNFSKEYREMPRVAKEKYIQNFAVRFTYDTNRIEGGTLTLRETANLLEEGITPKNKSLKDVKEAEAHEKVFFKILEYKKDLNLRTILNWHEILFRDTEPDMAGKIRTHGVGITGTKVELPTPVELELLLEEFFNWYHNNKKKLNPVELAALIHLKFVSIHPFSDGNGRISRLMMNFVLNKNDYPMLDIKYGNRDAYYTALERSQTKGIDYIFVQYFIRRYLKEYQRYLKAE